MGPLLSGAIATAYIRRGRTCLSSLNACVGATLGLVDSLTEGWRIPLIVKPYDRLSIIQYPQLLCGMAAIGEIFSFGGGLCLMLSQVTSWAYPCKIFSIVSAWS